MRNNPQFFPLKKPEKIGLFLLPFTKQYAMIKIPLFKSQQYDYITIISDGVDRSGSPDRTDYADRTTARA